MRVHVRFFASHRDRLGAGRPVELPTGATAALLVETLRREDPAACQVLSEDPAIAVNHEYARLETALADGDEVAFIPPVAGG